MKIFNGNTTYVQIKDLMFIKSIYNDEEIPPKLSELDLSDASNSNLFVAIDDIRPFMLKQFYILDFNLYHGFGVFETKMQLDGLDHVLEMYEKKLRTATTLKEIKNIKREILKNNYMETTLYEMFNMLYHKGPYNVPIVEKVNGESYCDAYMKVVETTNPSSFIFTKVDGTNFTSLDLRRGIVLDYISKLNISSGTKDNYEQYCFDVDYSDDKALVTFNNKRYGIEFSKQKKRK